MRQARPPAAAARKEHSCTGSYRPAPGWRSAAALARQPKVPLLPQVAASSTDPPLLITKRVLGKSLFEVVDSIDRDLAGRQLASFLAALHQRIFLAP